MTIVWGIFVAAAAIQISYYLLVFARLNFVRSAVSVPEDLPPVSVIICAHNEAENLKKYLKVVLIQQYPVFEVILVNDRSTDNTIDVMVDYYKRNTNVRVVHIAPEEPRLHGGKRDALKRGLDLAQHDIVVLTDADCRPAGIHWLAKMVSTYSRQTAVVLGYSPFEKTSGLGNKLMRYENLMTALQYLGFARAGMPYMGVGRNLSYRKNGKGVAAAQSRNTDLPTGDDDLLVNDVARKGNTEICIDSDSFVYTRAPETLKQWIRQKRRHLRSGFRYRWPHRFVLFLFACTGFLFYAGLLVLLVGFGQVFWSVVVWGFMGLLKMLSVAKIGRKLKATDLVWQLFFFDILYTGYLLVVFFLILLKPQKSWT